MEYIIGLIFLAIAFYVIYNLKMIGTKGISKHWFSGAFALKVIVAIIMLFLYSKDNEQKKKADIFRFFNDSKVISELISDKPVAYLKIMSGIDTDDSDLTPYYQKMNNWDYSQGNKLFSNNRLIIRYLAFINILTFGSYFADIVISIFLSFLGLFWIFRFYNTYVKNKKWILFSIIFFTPSIVFWTSGILKESLLVFAIGLMLNCGNYALRKRKPILRSVVVLLTLVLIYNIKAFVLFILIPPLLAYLWNFFKPKGKTIIPYFIMIFLAFSFASESGKIFKTGLFDMLLEKQLSFTELSIQENSNSRIHPILFSPNTESIVLNAPIAVINTLFRPMPWEASNIQMIASAIENILILILIILVVISPIKTIDNKNIFWLGITFSIMYFIIIGLSTNVLGAISRYRVPALIFFLLSIIQLIDTKRIKQVIIKK